MPTPSIKETISAHDEGEDLPRMGRAREAAKHCTVPAGWKLVPIEPTPEMVAAMAVIEASSHQVVTYGNGIEVVTELIGMSGAVEAYEAMLAAADPYPTGEVVGPCVCGSWPGGECLRCAQLLSAAPQSDGWRPIESAPKDGTHVRLYAPEIQFVGFHAVAGWCYVAPGCPLAPTQPTHWEPLSPAPTQGQSHGQ